MIKNLIIGAGFSAIFTKLVLKKKAKIIGCLDEKKIKKKILIRRLEKVQNLLFENQRRMNRPLENKVLNVLVENLTEDKTQVFGRSEHMTSIIFNGDKNDIGKVVQVKIKQSNRSTLFAEKIKSSNQKVA